MALPNANVTTTADLSTRTGCACPRTSLAITTNLPVGMDGASLECGLVMGITIVAMVLMRIQTTVLITLAVPTNSDAIMGVAFSNHGNVTMRTTVAMVVMKKVASIPLVLLANSLVPIIVAFHKPKFVMVSMTAKIM